ncbi:hypothetical protein [Erythrobacter sp. JK5]|uniref:hypothetical protein n=1 Tax=Erythrobacter sp. JK5 TaxID=2829500 RepID=UPI001BA8D412|nr:hypothetical protein [Erythrobacter sp. JK5]QUL37655.1 hypothetical protein KDC96_15120 [Erythrobacter sp. JK5]
MPITRTEADGTHLVIFEGVAAFRIDLPDKSVTICDVAADTSSAALEHLLFDQIAPRILEASGELVIHASAVEIAGRLAVFLGETGAGKSTLAASLDRVGHRLIGDDAITITQRGDEFCGKSVYPSLRLFPEAITAVLGTDVESAPMAHYSTKQRVSLPALAGGNHAEIPIAAVIFLVDGEEQDRPAIDRLSPGHTCLGLIEHCFALDPEDARCAAQRLAKISQLANSVPGYELSYAYDFDQLPLVHETILAGLGAADRQAGER